MGKKKPEMAQIYNGSNNEFIFGEHGGRGKNLSSFLKNLSLTGSRNLPPPDSFKEVNSNIYGNLSYGYHSPPKNSSGHILPPKRASSGTTFSLPPPEERNGRRTVSRQKYTDLDDDWDADLGDVAPNRDVSRVAADHVSNTRRLVLLPPGSLDMFPDLMIPVSSPVPNPKESMDDEDLQMKSEISRLNQLNLKYAKFTKVLLESTTINITEVRKLSWNGIPPELRAFTWQILLGYLPTNKLRQASTLKRKRQEYMDGIAAVESQLTEDLLPSDSRNNNNSANRDKQLFHQIKIDVKRTNPSQKLYVHEQTQESLRRILFLWALRHPASGYVQGINDLCTPFYQIFLHNYIWQLQRTSNEDDAPFLPGLLDPSDEQEQSLLQDKLLPSYTLDTFPVDKISKRVHSIIEADTYWCLSRLLDTITDNYIHEQPGILRLVSDLRNLVSKIDVELIQHLDREGVEFIQFAFRWMNCLLMREVLMGLIIRMWDTYLSETPLGFSTFHIYVCAAFLVKFSADLKQKDFQEILLFLQNPPTSSWKEKDIELMLSEAFIWQSLYKNASAHLR